MGVSPKAISGWRARNAANGSGFSFFEKLPLPNALLVAGLTAEAGTCSNWTGFFLCVEKEFLGFRGLLLFNTSSIEVLLKLVRKLVRSFFCAAYIEFLPFMLMVMLRRMGPRSSSKWIKSASDFPFKSSASSLFSFVSFAIRTDCGLWLNPLSDDGVNRVFTPKTFSGLSKKVLE